MSAPSNTTTVSRKSSSSTQAVGLDLARIRQDFPILEQKVHGAPLAYLDNAASAQKPRAVIDAVDRCYREYYANVHRGVHFLSQQATAAFEGARDIVRQFLNARETREIVFVRGTTEGINLVAHSYGRQHVGAGDEVLITAMEHHSNIVPWQMLCAEVGAHLRVAPIDERGEVILEEFEDLLTDRTRIVALVHVSNALGTINPVREMIELAHRHGAVVLLDGAQAAPHLPIDVQQLDVDFYTLSGHKVYGPGGIGALYGKAALLEEMPPYQGGGEMILKVTFEKSDFKAAPHRFEAGTPNIPGAIGLGAAVEYLRRFDWNALESHEEGLRQMATEGISEIPGVRLIGTARRKIGVVSFVVEGIHAHDVGTILDHEGVAVRSGHHCAQPVMDHFGIPASVRASFGLYNTPDEVEVLLKGLHKVREVFR